MVYAKVEEAEKCTIIKYFYLKGQTPKQMKEKLDTVLKDFSAK